MIYKEGYRRLEEWRPPTFSGPQWCGLYCAAVVVLWWNVFLGIVALGAVRAWQQWR